MNTGIQPGDTVRFVQDWQTFDNPAAPRAAKGAVVTVVAVEDSGAVLVRLTSPVFSDTPVRQYVPADVLDLVHPGDRAAREPVGEEPS